MTTNRVQNQEEVISDMKRENQFLSKEIGESTCIWLWERERSVNRVYNWILRRMAQWSTSHNEDYVSSKDNVHTVKRPEWDTARKREHYRDFVGGGKHKVQRDYQNKSKMAPYCQLMSYLGVSQTWWCRTASPFRSPPSPSLFPPSRKMRRLKGIM